MQITTRSAASRGHADHGWLESWHSFSFGQYQDPEHLGFRSLRVINEDIVQPGQGFGTHPHRDMEIVTYVLEGALAHRDGLGNASVLRPGDVQRMTAGSGVTHSEFNHSSTETVHLLQIWILPQAKGLEPGYQEQHFPASERQGRFCLLAAPGGVEGALHINQDARILATVLQAGQSASHELSRERHAWVQVARGAVTVQGDEPGSDHALDAGDGAAISQTAVVTLTAREPAEVLLFDLA